MSQERAIFAGGCFWCMVQPFEEMPGILSVLSGYTGGTTQNPTYEDVLSHQTGHTEAVEIIFDNDVVSYRELVALYWTLTDPTDACSLPFVSWPPDMSMILSVPNLLLSIAFFIWASS